MKPGYKQTDLGVLPEEWEVKTLGEIGDPVIGLTYDPANISDDGVLVLRSSNIQNEELDLDNQVRVKMRIPEKTYVQEDDLLICVRNGSRSLIGKCLLLDKRVNGAAFGAFMAVYRSPINKFVVHAFKSHIVAKQIEENLGATINSITNKDLSSYKIPLPPPAEQQAIAEALGAVDALLTAQRGLLAKKQDLKQATQQALLSEETRLPGFAGEWEVKTLGELGICVRGVSYNPEMDLRPHDTADTLRLLRSNNVAEGFINFNSLQFVEKSRVKPAQIMRSNDILICMANGSKDLVGKAGVFKPDNRFRYTFGAFMAAYRPDGSACDPSFMFYQFQTENYRRNIGDLLAGSSINNLNPSAINSIEIRCPEVDEQRAIAAILSGMDVELEALTAQVAKTQALKQGMMQDLLTGAVRLTPAAAAPSTTLTPSTAA